ncbi:MAG: FAD-binding oxidoreductase [candidate division FCPU426 bacterium]
MTTKGVPMQTLCGWGRYPRSQAQVEPVWSASDVQRRLAGRQGRPVLARGEGRSYGDASLNRDGWCLDCVPADRFLGFDAQRGRLHAEAGVTLEQVLHTLVPRGWFMPVTPGTQYPTLGGCVACDVHGKSRFPLGHYLRRLHLVLADGREVSCSPTEKPDLFWATVGGMGLTGVITSVELDLMKIESSYVKYEGLKAPNLEGIFRLLEETPAELMTVAWIDCLAQGRSLGRSILMRGRFAKQSELASARQRREPLAVPRKLKIAVPFDFPELALNPLSMHAFNLVYYGKHPRRLETIMDYDSFFYPLDSILHWNRGYGRRGMLQYQFLIPPPHSFEGVRAVLEAIAKTGKASFLAVLKKFGPMKNPAPLSFPEPGYFLALDFPVGDGSILKHMDEWDRLVLKFGGRLYLAKDSRMQRKTFERMYPRLKEWKRARAKYDPQGVFASDMGRRLGLVGG